MTTLMTYVAVATLPQASTDEAAIVQIVPTPPDVVIVTALPETVCL